MESSQFPENPKPRRRTIIDFDTLTENANYLKNLQSSEFQSYQQASDSLNEVYKKMYPNKYLAPVDIMEEQEVVFRCTNCENNLCSILKLNNIMFVINIRAICHNCTDNSNVNDLTSQMKITERDGNGRDLQVNYIYFV